MTDARTRSGEGEAADIYGRVREMAISFRFPPGQRINEGELAARLAVSRTPVREAMQKLVSENLLVWKRGSGFFCRELNPKEIAELYELRRGIEVMTVRLACRRAAADSLEGLERELDEIESGSRASESLLRRQLAFHEKIADLTGNLEIVRALKTINARLYFVRWVAMDGRWERSNREHREIVAAIKAGDENRAADLMELHLDERPEEISAWVREGYARIYTGELPSPGAGPLVEGEVA